MAKRDNVPIAAPAAAAAVVTTEPAAKRRAIKYVWNGPVLSAVFPLDDGGYTVLTFDETKAAEVMREEARRFGWVNRFANAASIPADKKTGKAPVRLKIAAVERLITHYESGSESWELDGHSEGGMLLEALVELAAAGASAPKLLQGRTREQLLAFLKSRTDADNRTLADSTAVLPIMTRLREERAKRNAVNTSDALGGLEAIE